MTKRKLIISGFGTVGRSLVREIVERRLFNVLRIVALIDSQGGVVKERGFTPKELVELLKMPRSNLSKHSEYGLSGLDTESVMREVEANVLVELTPSNYESGEPGLRNVLEAIKLGLDIVLANKSPIALLGLELFKRAEEAGVCLLYRATVMGGTPLIPLVKSVKSSVKKIYGILNATTNYILTSMYEREETFERALVRAQEEGIAEADPRLDVDGFDAAAKLSILACTLGYDLRINEVSRESARSVKLEEVVKRKRRGRVPKYIASLKVEESESEASVKVMYLKSSDLLSSVRGRYNGVYVETLQNKVFLMGLGAGGRATAESVLEDILTIVR